MEMAILTFDTSNEAIKGELLLQGKLPVRMIPLPPEIQSGCGLCLRIDASLADIRKVIKKYSVEGELYYVDSQIKTTYTKVSL